MVGDRSVHAALGENDDRLAGRARRCLPRHEGVGDVPIGGELRGEPLRPGERSEIRIPRRFDWSSSGPVFRLVLGDLAGRGTYGCGTAPDFDRLPRTPLPDSGQEQHARRGDVNRR